MKTICIANQKGGVGKTTTTVNIGAALAALGHSVVAVGLDEQRNLYDFDAPCGVQFVEVSPRGLAKRAHKLREKGADFVLIDCPPRLGVEVAHSLKCADLVLIPLQPEAMAVRGLSEMLQLVQAASDPAREGSNPDLRYKILLTMFDSSDPDSHDIERELRARFGDAVFSRVVKRARVINTAAWRRQSVQQFDAGHAVAVAYRALAREILSEVEHG